MYIYAMLVTSSVSCIYVCLSHQIEEANEINAVSVQDQLQDMRTQRLGLIQTPDQLRFSYIAILQGAIQLLHLVTDDNLDEEESEEEEEEENENDEKEEEKEEAQGLRFGEIDACICMLLSCVIWLTD